MQYKDTAAGFDALIQAMKKRMNNAGYLSTLFSKYEVLTLEKYIISQKIERIKQQIIENEYSLSEIAYMMNYSSVQYLSTQFKKETGMTVTKFKENFGLCSKT